MQVGGSRHASSFKPERDCLSTILATSRGHVNEQNTTTTASARTVTTTPATTSPTVKLSVLRNVEAGL